MKAHHSTTARRLRHLRCGRLKLCCQLLLLAANAAMLQGPPLRGGEPPGAARPSIFVAPMQLDRRMQKSQPALGQGLAEMLVTELSNLKQFRVLESSSLKSGKGEIQLGPQNGTRKRGKAEKNPGKGADYLFVGTITRFGSNEKSYGGGFLKSFIPVRDLSMPEMSQNQAVVQIDWRIDDMATREVVKSGRAEGKETGTSWGLESSSRGGFHKQHEFLDSAMGKATMKALAQITASLRTFKPGPSTAVPAQEAKAQTKSDPPPATEQPVPAAQALVEAVTPTFLVVAMGSNEGLKVGDKLNLVKVTEVRNKNKEVVLRDEEPVGEVTVESVQADKCKVGFPANLKPEEGWMVRVREARQTLPATAKN